MLWNWPKNASNVEDDEYKTPKLSYSKKLDSLILTSCITRSQEEEESSPPHIEDVVTNSKKEMENTLPPFQGYAKMFQKTWPQHLHHGGFQQTEQLINGT